MAELAAGAVSSLLGVLRKEALLLRRVGNDVEFIKEEMESMNSFLEHLARTAPPGGEHSEQVRTWMKQVRDLAHDCSNCIDRYLRRGDPAIHRARSGLRRYAMWAYWLVQEMIAQHSAAIRLRELKERARDVGTRRLRYGVELPGKSADSDTGREDKEGEDDDDDDYDDAQNLAAVEDDTSDPRRRAQQPSSLEDYCARKLGDWLERHAKTKTEGAIISSISIVVPDAESANAITREAMGLVQAHCFEKPVCINLAEVQYPWDLPLLTREILSYILREFSGDTTSHYIHRYGVFSDMWKKIYEIDLGSKIKEIMDKLAEVEKKIVEEERGNRTEEKKMEPLRVLLQALRLIKADMEQLPPPSSEHILKMVAEKLKMHMEEPKKPPICLHVTQYEDILRKVYPDTASGSKLEEGGGAAATTSAMPVLPHKEVVSHSHKITLEIIREVPPKPQTLLPGSAIVEQQARGDVNDQTKEGSEPADKIPSENKKTRLMITGTIDMMTLDIIGEQELLEGSYPAAKKLASTGTPGGEIGINNRYIAAAVTEAKESLPNVEWPIQTQLMIKGIVDKIKEHLKGNKEKLIILQDEKDYVSRYWEDTRNALGLLGDHATAVIIITTNNQKAKEYCFPPGEPITYSLVGLYHDAILQLTSLHAHAENEDADSHSKVIRGILDKCDPHELSMKMFAHALYANPNRSKEELQKLHDALQGPKKSLAAKAKKIFKFSYRDLPREHKTCLLYLAIFPRGLKIRRSILIGRWLTEGLITKEDWPTAVHHAEECFDALIDRWLLWPGDVGAAGKVKSCMLGDLIHGFVTKAAKKQHILDARLSHLWAHHFSIFSGLRLRTSDGIDKFVKNLPAYSPQLPLLKLLDLEGCHCLDMNRRYLKDICRNILLVKYLSLRGTNITHLPSEINNLHELEVLDIRQTKVPENATANVLLLKLRRLLAGHVDPSTNSHDKGKLVRDAESFSYVQIPNKIEKMENMEVLSNVKASRNGDELKDISKLWQLRKLGVVIDDDEAHLRNFLRAISDQNECLQSLSIILPETRSQGVNPTKKILPESIYKSLMQPPKLLESISINGVTKRVNLLTLLATGSNELSKVTLCRTLLTQENLEVLGANPKLRCVRLRHNAYSGKELTFKKNEFMHLKYFLIEGTNISETEESMTETDIKFEGGAAELEKIVLSFTNIRSLSGIGSLTKLNELELKCNKFLLSFSRDGASHKGNTDAGAPLQDTQSGDPMQNIHGGAPEQNSQSINNVDQDIRNEVPEQNTQNRDVEQNTESKTIEENAQSEAAKENIENVAPDKNIKSMFIFKKKEFEHLKIFLVEDTNITSIIFEEGAVPKLEKIVLSLKNENSELIGVTYLSKLKEIELNGCKFLLSSFLKVGQISKATLRDTKLKKDDLENWVMKLNLRCLVLSENSYDEIQISFDKLKFPNLNLLIVECPNINGISFTDTSAAPNLEKIIWSFTKMDYLSGINYLPKLQELELNGEIVPRQVAKDIIAHKGLPILIHKKPLQQDREKRSDDEEGNQQFSCFSKFKNWH
ncbi:hypothetical protein BS78_05G236200 [Paspalum vaginatum]|nr:hypothetical protein BS78_05G236200 [Paspalum vaginatum]